MKTTFGLSSKDGMTETTATATRRNHRSEAKNGGTSPSTGNSGKTRQAQQEAETAFHNSKEEENDDHDNDDHIFSQEQTPPKTSGINQTENSTTNKTKRKRAKKKTKTPAREDVLKELESVRKEVEEQRRRRGLALKYDLPAAPAPHHDHNPPHL